MWGKETVCLFMNQYLMIRMMNSSYILRSFELFLRENSKPRVVRMEAVAGNVSSIPAIFPFKGSSITKQ